jgi:Ras-related protein Rab-11A
MNVESAFTEVLTQIYRVVIKKALGIGDDPAAPPRGKPSMLEARMMSLL